MFKKVRRIRTNRQNVRRRKLIMHDAARPELCREGSVSSHNEPCRGEGKE